jgi:hypothetical protein
MAEDIRRASYDVTGEAAAPGQEWRSAHEAELTQSVADRIRPPITPTR